MKRTIAAVLISAISMSLLFSGCSKSTGTSAIGAGNVEIKNEKILKEFSGSINVFKRINDTVMLTAENGENFQNYNVRIDTAELIEKDTAQADDQYSYYEPVGDKGYLYVEGENTQSILKYKDSKGTENIIANNLGYSDSVDISIAPKGGKLAYAALKEGSEQYSLHLYDIATGNSFILIDQMGNELVKDFGYLVNWSQDEKYVIIQNKYIFETQNGTKKGEIKAAYTRWSPSSQQIAFILEEDADKWLSDTDSQVYPGKTVCVYDMKAGSYQEVFIITSDEYVFGDLTWSGDEKKLAFTGIIVKDKTSQDWYMKLIYNSIYILDIAEKKAKRYETKVDASNGDMIELTNLKFSNEGKLLSYTVGNYDKCNLYMLNTESLEVKPFENAEYLHWLSDEDYAVASGKNTLYFCKDNKLIRIDEKLKEEVKYISKLKLDDFYLAADGKAVVLFEAQGNGYVIRYLGK